MTHSFFVLRSVLTAFVLLGLISPCAFAQGLSVKVHWTKDSTVTPGVEECTAGGTVGGNATIHIRFTPPSNIYGSPRLQEIRVHENAGHTADFVVSAPSPSFQGQADIACGDDPNQSAFYHDEHWASTGGHNGSHTITVTVEYSTFNYPYGGQTYTVSATPITVDAQNLLITGTSPANPEPIKWDPDTMSSTGVPLSATISAAYKANWPVKLQIFDSAQVLVKTYEQTLPIGGGASTVNFTWDGTQDNPTPGPAPKGIYLFQWTVGVGMSNGDIDTDKSGALTVSAPGQDVEEVVSDDGTTATYKVLYTLSSRDNRPASSGQIKVYNPDLDEISAKALGGADLTPGSHEVTLSMPPLDIAGSYVFLVNPWDNHADQDKGHRIRLALQHNQKSTKGATIAYSHGQFNSHCLYWTKHMRKIGYRRVPKRPRGAYNWWYGDPNIADMRGPLEFTQNRIKPLKTVMFSGHGDPNGDYLVLAGPADMVIRTAITLYLQAPLPWEQRRVLRKSWCPPGRFGRPETWQIRIALFLRLSRQWVKHL